MRLDILDKLGYKVCFWSGLILFHNRYEKKNVTSTRHTKRTPRNY